MINAEEVILEVRNMLSDWFDANKIDESVFYPAIRKCLSKMGMDTGVERPPVMVYVSGYKADLPKDFKKLVSAVSCIAKTFKRPVSEAVMTYEVIEVGQNYDVYKDDCGLPTSVVRKLPYEVYEWNQFELLRISKESIPSCDTNCLNFLSKSTDTIRIVGNKLYTQFETGAIYLEYIGNSDELFLPDNETILDWVKECLMVEAYTYLVHHGEPNVADLLRLVTTNRHIKEEQARPVWKRSELHEFYDLRNTLSRRYRALSAGMLNDTRYSRYNLR